MYLIMKILEPYYYKDFQCIGSQCKSTCCAGWGIWIEKKSFLKYKKISGEFGEFLNRNIRKRRKRENDNEFGEFVLKLDGRCPILNDDNLCELYINCGESYLSRTCKTHPRLINQYSNYILERNLQLTCPVVAKYLVENKMLEFVLKNESLTELDKSGGVLWFNISESEFDFFWKGRAFLIDIAQFKEIKINARLIFIKLAQSRFQELMDKNEFEKIGYTIELLNEYVTDQKNIEILEQRENKNLAEKYLFASEIIKLTLDNSSYPNEEFINMIQIVAKFTFEIDEKKESFIEEIENQFETYFKDKQYVLENYIVYNLYTHYMGIMEDFDAEKVINNLMVSYLIIKILLLVIWNEKKSLEDSQIEEILYMYSKNMQELSSRVLINDYVKREEYNTLAKMSMLLW